MSIKMLRAKRMNLRHFMFYAAGSVLPRKQQTEAFRYLLQYNCRPPPIFILLVSLLQLVCHILTFKKSEYVLCLIIDVILIVYLCVKEINKCLVNEI